MADTLRQRIEQMRDTQLDHYSMVNAALLKEMLTAALALPDDTPWRDAVDRELMAQGCTVETFGSDPARCLNEIVKWNQAIAVDPLVNGGFVLRPVTLPDAAPQIYAVPPVTVEVLEPDEADPHALTAEEWAELASACDYLVGVAPAVGRRAWMQLSAKCVDWARKEPR